MYHTTACINPWTDAPLQPILRPVRVPVRHIMPAHAPSSSSASSATAAPRDPDAATALLHAAGDDREALAEAIAAAAFLDATPGDHRQKLRGRCGVYACRGFANARPRGCGTVRGGCGAAGAPEEKHGTACGQGHAGKRCHLRCVWLASALDASERCQLRHAQGLVANAHSGLVEVMVQHLSLSD